jgi:hypothetical protein
MLNPFLHSEMNSEQQKIVIRINLYDQVPVKKNHFLKQLAKAFSHQFLLNHAFHKYYINFSTSIVG